MLAGRELPTFLQFQRPEELVKTRHIFMVNSGVGNDGIWDLGVGPLLRAA